MRSRKNDTTVDKLIGLFIELAPGPDDAWLAFIEAYLLRFEPRKRYFD